MTTNKQIQEAHEAQLKNKSDGALDQMLIALVIASGFIAGTPEQASALVHKARTLADAYAKEMCK